MVHGTECACVADLNHPLDPCLRLQARAEAPNSLRAAFGTDTTYNACHGSDAPETAAAEAEFFFGQGRMPGMCAQLRGTTLAVIKPHLVKDGAAGLVIDVIQVRRAGQGRACSSRGRGVVGAAFGYRPCQASEASRQQCLSVWGWREGRVEKPAVPKLPKA